jgi:hypothetical protein
MHPNLDLVYVILSTSKTHDLTLVESVCTNIEDLIVNEDDYPLDASRLLFKLLSIAAPSNISSKPIERSYVKLLHLSMNADEFVKVGYVLAYFLQVHSTHGENGLKGAKFQLPFPGGDSGSKGSVAVEAKAKDKMKSWDIHLTSIKAVQEFILVWCNVYRRINESNLFDTTNIAQDGSSILLVFASCVSKSKLSMKTLLAVCSAIVVHVNKFKESVEVFTGTKVAFDGILSWYVSNFD